MGVQVDSDPNTSYLSPFFPLSSAFKRARYMSALDGAGKKKKGSKSKSRSSTRSIITTTQPIAVTSNMFTQPRTLAFGYQSSIPSTKSVSTREKITREVLLSTVSGKPFEDVKFFAFSRHSRKGTIDRPLPLISNSALIAHTSTHFSACESFMINAEYYALLI